MADAPERFEDLPPKLRARLRAAVEPPDPRRLATRARKAFYLALASGLVLLLPGAWLASIVGAPMALVNAAVVLWETQGSARQGRTRTQAWIAVAVAVLVLAAVAIHVWRVGRLSRELLRALVG